MVHANSGLATASGGKTSNKVELFFIGVLLDANIFDNFSEHDMHMRMEELMLKVSHLQITHLLSLYVKDLSPIKDGLTHSDGETIKG